MRCEWKQEATWSPRALVPGARDFRLRLDDRRCLRTVSTPITGAAGLKLAPARGDRWAHRSPAITLEPQTRDPYQTHWGKHHLQAVGLPEGQTTEQAAGVHLGPGPTPTPRDDNCITPSITLCDVSYIMTSDETHVPGQSNASDGRCWREIHDMTRRTWNRQSTCSKPWITAKA